MMRKYLILICACLLIFACDDILEVEDISDKSVIVLAPSDDVVLNSNDLNFSWEPLEDVESYHLQVATPSFEAAAQIVLDTLITTTSYSATLDFNTYQWRIRAENSEYQTEYTIQSFTINE